MHRSYSLLLLLLALLGSVILGAVAQETDNNDDLGIDDDDNGQTDGLLAQRIRGSLNAAAHQQAMAKLEQNIMAQLDVSAQAGIAAVKQATTAFMETQSEETEQALLLSVEQFARSQNLDGDAMLIAQGVVSQLKQSSENGICWACPFCAIFAGPLSLAFPGLHAAMKGRCSSHGPINTVMKGQLSCHFPSLNLNGVTLYWGCTYLNENLFGDHDIGMVPDGQTFGSDVFLKKSTRDDPSAVMTIMHELVHVKQYKDYGGDIQFGFKYLYHFCLQGFKYLSIDEEVAAYNFAKNRPLCTTRSPTAPTTRAPTKAPQKRANGSPCSSPTQCLSGNCEEFELPKFTVQKCAPF